MSIMLLRSIQSSHYVNWPVNNCVNNMLTATALIYHFPCETILFCPMWFSSKVLAYENINHGVTNYREGTVRRLLGSRGASSEGSSRPRASPRHCCEYSVQPSRPVPRLKRERGDRATPPLLPAHRVKLYSVVYTVRELSAKRNGI